MAREPASIRYKNPGAMWGGAHAAKWGAINGGKGVALADGTGQGNTIAQFPTYVDGIAAQIALWRTPRYRNKPFKVAIIPWSGGNNVPSYIAFVAKRVPGFTGNDIIDDAFLNSERGIAFLKAQAWHEAGKKYPAPDADFVEAQKLVFGGVSKPAKKPATPSVQTAPVPVTADRPGIWTTLWRSLRGKDAAIATPTVKDRPGMGLNGDNALYDQQAMLSDKGYTEVGQPDGLMGGRTINAIRAFRAENGLPPGDAIDTKFSATLAAAGPRQIAKARVETKASDLRAKGNEQVATLDSLGWLGKALGLGGILGGLNESGVLSQATDTLQTAQDTLGSIATVFTTIIGAALWCFAHWWVFAILGGLYVVFKVASGVLHVVVMFRQGFLARADK